MPRDVVAVGLAPYASIPQNNSIPDCSFYDPVVLESPLGPLVPESGSAPLPTVSFQAGRTLPLKLGLTCGTWKLSSNEVQPPRLVAITSLGSPVAGAVNVAPVASSADSGGLFRSENTNWIYNLSTQGMEPGLYALTIKMPDGVSYRTLISLR